MMLGGRSLRKERMTGVAWRGVAEVKAVTVGMWGPPHGCEQLESVSY